MKKPKIESHGIVPLMKQTSLFKNNHSLYFGGQIGLGKRKSRRPLNRNSPMHMVLKARRGINLFKNKSLIKSKLNKYSKKFGVKIYSSSVQINHVHINLRITNRKLYNGFIRSLTGVLARFFGKGVWKILPFTRLGHWGRDYKGVEKYIQQNELEVLGTIPYQIRKNRYSLPTGST